MALVVETGAGIANAESYISVAEATIFHAVRGHDVEWDAIDNKEAALRKATDFITQNYHSRWIGKRVLVTQALDWPRSAASWPGYGSGDRPSNTIPQELKNATAELALKTKDGDLLQDLGRETSSERVDVISVTYVQGSGRQTRYASIEGWLSVLIGTSALNMIPMSRA